MQVLLELFDFMDGSEKRECIFRLKYSIGLLDFQSDTTQIEFENKRIFVWEKRTRNSNVDEKRSRDGASIDNYFCSYQILNFESKLSYLYIWSFRK
jgi:hypothetical protein